MTQYPSNPQAVLLMKQVTKAQKMVVVSEGALKALQASCEHNFLIQEQGADLYGFGRREGNTYFKRKELCSKCGFTHNTESDLPHCVACNTPMPLAGREDIREHRAEFESIPHGGSKEKDIFPMGMPRGYRCPKCGRPHMYREAGD